LRGEGRRPLFPRYFQDRDRFRHQQN
jgi:hypothetical protein